MKISDLVNNNGVFIDFSNQRILYFELFRSEEYDIKYGLTLNGFLIESNRHANCIPYEADNYIAFVKILQIPFDSLIVAIRNSSRNMLIQNGDIAELFPIKKIAKTVFVMESNYWSKLAVEFLIFYQINDLELKEFFASKLNDKWITRRLRRLVMKYIKSGG